MTRTFTARLLIAAATLLAAAPALATTYHCRPTTDAPAGSDANDGLSYATSWATIKKFFALPPADGDILLVHTGTYNADANPTSISQANCNNKTLTVQTTDGPVTYINSGATQQILITTGGSAWTGGKKITFTASGGAFTFQPTNGTVVFCDQPVNTYGVVEFDFQNLIIGAANAQTKILRMMDNNSKGIIIRFTGCTCHAASVPQSAADDASIGQLGNSSTSGRQWDQVEFSNCTLECGAHYGFYLAGAGNVLTLNNNTWTCGTGIAMSGSGNSAIYSVDAGANNIGRIILNGNNFSALTCRGPDIPGGCTYVECDSNTVTINASDGGANTSSAIGIALGADGAAYTNKPYVVCRRNNVTQLGSTRSHGILFGRGMASGGSCTENIVTGGNYQLVVKSAGATIAGNVLYASGAGRTGMIVRSAVANLIAYNTVYSNDGDAIQFDDQALQAGAATPANNIVRDNIIAIGPTSTGNCIVDRTLQQSGTDGISGTTTSKFDATGVSDWRTVAVASRSYLVQSGGTGVFAGKDGRYAITSIEATAGLEFTTATACNTDGAPPGHGACNWAIYLDGQAQTYTFRKNAYYYASGTGNIGNINNTTCANLAALKTAWAAYAGQAASNDSDSIEGAALSVADLTTLRNMTWPGTRFNGGTVWLQIGARQNVGGYYGYPYP